ncbi:hypothetical protein [Chitinilyticum piscinae]|uniref:Uncharacterized protein n=1 Tax=Chitinilyticum piscinae TaxID=2866724 RepID=A0A8J7KA73_9NEIS|nr:hypothetical protein [Chitinilyticum piscinae]MBE9608854.1 hypothetical protein [Chitinilyticum piscinae]
MNIYKKFTSFSLYWRIVLLFLVVAANAAIAIELEQLGLQLAADIFKISTAIWMLAAAFVFYGGLPNHIRNLWKDATNYHKRIKAPEHSRTQKQQSVAGYNQSAAHILLAPYS